MVFRGDISKAIGLTSEILFDKDIDLFIRMEFKKTLQLIISLSEKEDELGEKVASLMD